jgi:RNA polymerase sigma factor (sigma-70 family)
MRKRHRMEIVDPEDLREPREQHRGDDAEPSVLDWISDRELLLFVERLPLPQRQVLLLRYMLDLTDRQIAPILGRTPSEVRVLQYRALSFLRERLAAIGRSSATGRRAQHRRRFREAPVLRQRRFAMSP